LDFDVDEQSEVEVDLILLDQWKVAKVKQIGILGHVYTTGSEKFF
jgi:nicotinate-nucleotide pyrophosphorylase